MIMHLCAGPERNNISQSLQIYRRVYVLILNSCVVFHIQHWFKKYLLLFISLKNRFYRTWLWLNIVIACTGTRCPSLAVVLWSQSRPFIFSASSLKIVCGDGSNLMKGERTRTLRWWLHHYTLHQRGSISVPHGHTVHILHAGSHQRERERVITERYM